MYRVAALNCFRYLGYTSFDQVDRLTLPEYRLLMQAVRLKQVDMDYRQHLQAFLSFAVQAEKPAGRGKSKPVYRRFKQFYDYEKALKQVEGFDTKKDRFAGLKKFLKGGRGDGG